MAVRVVKILDGDTLDVVPTEQSGKALLYRVRLAEIDAPEKDHPYGKTSATLLGQLVTCQPITLRYRECDRDHRIIGRLYVAQNYVAEIMIRNGAAWFNSHAATMPISMTSKTERTTPNKACGIFPSARS